jgi:hypothetical protein
MKTRLYLLIFTFAFCGLASTAWSAVWNYWYIPHLAFGSGYTSYLTIRDPQSSPRWVYVALRDDAGSLLSANVEGIGQTNTNPDTNAAPYYGYSFYFQLSASQEKTFAITDSGGLKTGWVSITGEGIGNLSSSLRFTTKDSSGNPTDVVGILPAESNFDWTVSVEKRGSTDYTGLAVANPYAQPLTFTVVFYQNGNRVPGTSPRSFTLPANGHWARFVHESALFGDAWGSYSGIGTLKISSTTGSFSAVALRGDGTQYSSLPADVGAQNWSVTYAGASGSTTWAWRMFDGYHFIGYEQNYEDGGHVGQRARIRGVVASDLTPAMFVADWIYASSDGSVQGMILFQGVPGKEGSTDVINGTRTDLNKDGAQKSQVTFKATRVY